MIVGWQVADHLRADLVLDALEMAIWSGAAGRKHGLDEVVHHSDRSVQLGFKESSRHCSSCSSTMRAIGSLSVPFHLHSVTGQS